MDYGEFRIALSRVEYFGDFFTIHLVIDVGIKGIKCLWRIALSRIRYFDDFFSFGDPFEGSREWDIISKYRI